MTASTDEYCSPTGATPSSIGEESSRLGRPALVCSLAASLIAAWMCCLNLSVIWWVVIDVRFSEKLKSWDYL